MGKRIIRVIELVPEIKTAYHDGENWVVDIRDAIVLTSGGAYRCRNSALKLFEPTFEPNYDNPPSEPPSKGRLMNGK